MDQTEVIIPVVVIGGLIAVGLIVFFVHRWVKSRSHREHPQIDHVGNDDL
jgi:hypothetical protein